jgi:hypothetical protein
MVARCHSRGCRSDGHDGAGTFVSEDTRLSLGGLVFLQKRSG